MKQLDELVCSFAEHKQAEGDLKKICDTENAQIKDLMAANHLSKYEAGGYQVNYIESVREKLNEEQLLELLKKRFSKKQLKDMKVIKVVEQVDENALESAIYNNLVGADFVQEMAACKESSTITSIRLTKKKER